jgi:hypothetical protein
MKKTTTKTAIPAAHPYRCAGGTRDKEAVMRRASVKAERAAWEARSADAYAAMVAQTATQ